MRVAPADEFRRNEVGREKKLKALFGKKPRHKRRRFEFAPAGLRVAVDLAANCDERFRIDRIGPAGQEMQHALGLLGGADVGSVSHWEA